jgi:N-acetylglutamate synthase-like GNAT family acetyltransferase
MKQLIIREAKKSDLKLILKLHRQLSLTNEETLSLKKAEYLFEQIEKYPSYTIFVALIEKGIIGTFALLIMDNLAHLGMPSGIIEDVVVEDSVRGSGIGREMVHFAMQQCAEKGCYKMMLSTNTKRQRAHKFYENLGFEKHGFSYTVNINNPPRRIR